MKNTPRQLTRLAHALCGALMCPTMRDLVPALRVLLLVRIILCVNAPFHDLKINMLTSFQ
jgi:hypothetical protein